jgi:regulator of protease activity HflC (stomatin/prohibitin superfamily)
LHEAEPAHTFQALAPVALSPGAAGENTMDFGLDGFSIALIALGVLAILVLFAGAKTVPQGYNYTIERFGRYIRTLKPGLNLIIPFVDGIGKKINMMEQVLDVPHQEVITRDNATVTANGVTFYQILDAAAAAYEVSNLEVAILNLTMTNIRSVMGSMDLDELLSNRDEINQRLLKVVDAAVSPWGLKITRIEIKDIDPPKDLVESMGRQMKAEREKRALILEAEGKRQAAILQAEGAKQSQVLEAEGRREAAFRDAEARERSAEAEAKATEMVSNAIASGNVQAINYFVANNYIKALESLARSPNQKVLMLPVEAASVIGAIGGIAEIAKETFGSGSTPPRGSSSRPPSTGQ